MKNYYEILEVNNKASLDIIKKVFKLQIKKYHPDLFPDNKKKWAEEKVKDLNEAYDTLSNEQKRNEYDNLLKEYQNNDELSKKEEILNKQIEYLKEKLNKKDQIIEHFLGGLDLSEYDYNSDEDIELNLENIKNNSTQEIQNQDMEYTTNNNIKQNNIPYHDNPKNLLEKIQNFFSSSRPYKNNFDYYIHNLLILLLKIVLFIIFAIICFSIISIITHVNVFELFINVFFNTSNT